MFNEYQHRFLERFVRHDVRFLIIGGQARRIHFGGDTRDLDLWVDISPEAQTSLETALLEWSVNHPLHTQAPLQAPLAFAPMRQVAFPDAPCMYMLASGEAAEIIPEDGVDILTSIGDANFDCYLSRAYWQTIGGLRLAFLSSEDTRAFSPEQSSFDPAALQTPPRLGVAERCAASDNHGA